MALEGFSSRRNQLILVYVLCVGALAVAVLAVLASRVFLAKHGPETGPAVVVQAERPAESTPPPSVTVVTPPPLPPDLGDSDRAGLDDSDDGEPEEPSDRPWIAGEDFASTPSIFWAPSDLSEGVAGEEGLVFVPPQTPEATPDPAEHASVSGRVAGPDGRVVAGAEVVLAMMGSTAEEGFFRTRSRENGVYSFEGLPPGRARVYIPGPVQRFETAADAVEAARDGVVPLPPLYPPEPKEAVLIAGEETRGVHFILERGGVLHGRVINREGQPVEAARASARMGGATIATAADRQGRFVIEGVPPGGAITALTIVHPEYQPRTRTNVSVLDGEQVFVLERSNAVMLAVRWRFDRSPVNYYSYRVLRRSITGVDVATGMQRIAVETEDGLSPLEGLEAGHWKVEVTVMDSEGRPVDIRNSAEFDLTAGETDREIEVLMDSGAVLRGRVAMMEPGGEPVPQARVSFENPSQGFGNFVAPPPAFEQPVLYTNSEGRFAFEGVPPGRYTMTASKSGLVAPEAIDVYIPYEEQPQELEIVMIGGGRVYGTAVDREGRPLYGARVAFSVQRLDADGWYHLNTETDPNGFYEFTGLTTGSQYVWLYGPDGMQDSQNFNLAAGEEREVNFDFSDTVTLRGRVTVNAENPLPQYSHVRFVSGGAVLADVSTLTPDGEYEAKVTPGIYTMHLYGSRSAWGNEGAFEIQSSPKEQRRDFNIDIVPVDVVLHFPEDSSFEAGNLVISPESRDLRYNFFRQRMEQPTKHIPQMRGGVYQATFTTRDGKWHGASEWVTVAGGAENVFYIEVENVQRGIKIGEWRSGEVSNTQRTPLRFDITPHLASTGKLTIYVSYESGRHAAEIGPVTLLEDGNPISHDPRAGWTGADHWNNRYVLHLDQRSPQARYEIEVSLRADGGTDSNGSVYMDVN